jgi:hypothetical protein
MYDLKEIHLKRDVTNLEQLKTQDWMRHIPKILKAGAILAIISIFLPATHNFDSAMGATLMEFIWYFGLYFGSISGGGYSETQIEFLDFSEYLTPGIATLVLLIVAFILMFTASNKARTETEYKISAASAGLGGILALAGIGVYYIGLKEEIPGWWTVGDPSFGFYLPIIGGILGIIGAVAAGYVYSLEIKGEPIQKFPIPDKMATETQVDTSSEAEKPMFCKNCGTKLVGEYCQECGQKAEFLIQ